ncbi:MAG: hypothetical protein AMS27_10795 [Bacteroides sp. SM23_62_1]|nr:MAG: hypothetical protein AMS27_10795 [Bacteroides sp. SM23_62_1]
MAESHLILPDYTPAAKIYYIEAPEIQTGDTYYFVTDSGLKYQVRFGKKRDNYLGNIVNFSVLSEEFEDEYSETNRGEVYRIIATVIEIVRLYHSCHIHSDTYEFTGEFKDNKDKQESSIRTRLYFRYAKMILSPEWEAHLEGNKVIVKKTI